MNSLIISAVGSDRPGIISELSGIITTHGGNVEESRMSRLGSDFAIIMLVSVSTDWEESLEVALQSINELTISTKFTQIQKIGDNKKYQIDLKFRHVGIKIAIADDNSFLISAVKEKLSFFEDLNCKFSALNGSDLLEKLEDNHNLDLILMDIQLPEISGLEVTKMLKADDDLKSIPVIAVTAFAMKGDEEKIREGGCEGYIAKPISVPTFLDTISKFLN